MIKRINILVLMCLIATISIGQYRHSNGASKSEIGFFGGGASYLGDINPFNPFREINASASVVYKYNFSSRFAFRANVSYLRINASDSKSNDEFLKNRNLNFRNDILEIGAGIEMNFFKYIPSLCGDKARARSERAGYPFSPYMFLQIAYFHHNPKGLYQGQWIKLRNLGTEGQGLPNGEKPYSLHQVSLPFGLGFKVNIGKQVSLSFEYAIRMTFTDYLDDVSGVYADYDQIAANNGSIAAIMSDRSIVKTGPGGRNTGIARGTGSKIDWYQTFGVSISFRLGKGDICYYKI